MAEQPLRELDDIRRDCVRKLRSVQMTGMIVAILGYFVGEDWATPKIEEMLISPDGEILVRVAGDEILRAFIGTESDLIRNIHGVARAAKLDGDEIGYLLGNVAEIKGTG